MEKELTLKEKVEWIKDNEGCELADGWSALDTFLGYCVNDDDEGNIENSILELCKDDIEYQYDTVKGEQECQMEDDVELCSDSILKKVLVNGFTGDIDKLQEDIKKTLKIYLGIE